MWTALYVQYVLYIVYTPIVSLYRYYSARWTVASQLILDDYFYVFDAFDVLRCVFLAYCKSLCKYLKFKVV